ncbi:MAG: TIM barrel protein [Candidatus Hadarchaeales archaeon]
MWGLSTFTYPWAIGIAGYPPSHPLTLEELFERAHTFGAQVVQISHNFPLHTLGEKELKRIKDLAQKYNLVIEIGTLGIREPHLLAYLRIAEKLDARLVRTLLDGPNDSPSLEEAEREIRAVLPHFATKNIYLLLENYEGRKNEELLVLFRKIKHPYFKFCFDTANSLGDVVCFRPPYQLGFIIEGRPLGKGTLGIEWVFDMLCAQQEVSYIIELLTPWQGSMESTIEKEAEWADESVRFLRNFLENKRRRPS